MNDQIPNIEKYNVKPCRKCGAQERYKNGNCKPCSREAIRKWHKANPDKSRECVQRWNKANPEKISAAAKKWRKNNRKKQTELSQKWLKENPERLAIYASNRRSRLNGNGGKLSSNIVQALMSLQKGKCACCGKSLRDGYHLDHIMPLALGGSNSDDNVQLLTPLCNLRKGAKHPVEYMKEKGFLL